LAAVLLAAGCVHVPAPEVIEASQAVTSLPAAAKMAGGLATQTPRVAITLDDLGASQASVAPKLSERILKSLERARAPVAVFVNCAELTEDALFAWHRAGATIGNHTATHLSIDAAGPDDAWWHDVEGCDRRIRGLLGQPVRYFRFPYLRYGRTAESRQLAKQKLTSLGYEVAHVTAATSEWLIADYYETAVDKHDASLEAELSALYVEHMVRSLQTARDLALEKVGHDVAHITLAHVNRLAADHLGDVLDAFESRGWQFISLKQALADPVYSLTDAYTGSCGCSWLARIEPALESGDVYAFGDFEDQIRARFEARVAALEKL